MCDPWPGCILCSYKPALPSPLCLLAVPHPTPRLSLQISAFCTLIPLAYFSVPSQIAASFSPPSSISPHCSCGTFPAKLFLPAHFQQSATLPPHPRSPFLLLHGLPVSMAPSAVGTGHVSALRPARYLSSLLGFVLHTGRSFV